MKSDKLLEMTKKVLQEDVIGDIDELHICTELQKVKNIIKAEFNPNFEDYSHKGCYILYLSKYLIKLANQWSVGVSGMRARLDTRSDIKDILNKYYKESSYRFDYGDDYNGYWYVLIDKEGNN